MAAGDVGGGLGMVGRGGGGFIGAGLLGACGHAGYCIHVPTVYVSSTGGYCSLGLREYGGDTVNGGFGADVSEGYCHKVVPAVVVVGRKISIL